jgi:UDP-N-acetylmuramoyl-L-alanyl-D-glutamate--2,6-diaminopimelate ligase
MSSLPRSNDLLSAAGVAAVSGLPASFTGLSADSRAIGPGMLYAALPGARLDGRDFIADAVARGAAAVLAPVGTVWPEGVPPVPLLTDLEPRRALARMAAVQAGAQPGCVIAVTGTNGKTSTAEFIRQLKTASGGKAASLGTLGVIAPGRAGGSGLTTPDPVSLAQTLADLAREGVETAAIEASSHGLDQFRLDGVRLAAAGFSNLTRDHLDYHGTLDAYRDAKLRLFRDLLPAGAPSVLSTALDAQTAAMIPGAHTVGEGGTLLNLHRALPHPGGQTLEIKGFGTIELKLPGRFQADNALLAAGLAMVTGTNDAVALLSRLTGVRGRMELAAETDEAAIYVDYAHTPDALERLLLALRPHTTGRLHVVFGAGGDRDRGKRPLMGAIAARLADRAIITDDNPRSEDPSSIRAAIHAACPEALEIGDRAQAIAAGLDGLRRGDVLVVAGKGHEQGQTIGTETIPFDDVATVRRLM